jgi:formylmethanofuran dehydrogenase subunit A
MGKVYSIYLGDYKFGTTHLEKADAPMGVVYGAIEFNDLNIGYEFIKDYCKKRQIELAADYPEDKLISTKTIDELKIVNDKGIEIKGIGNQIDGMDNDGFEISIEGIPYPFYEEEFPNHVKEYENLLKNKK